jgi:hypothetical protein
MTANRTGTRILNFFQHWLGHRYLPVLLALGAVLVMLPAVKTGLIADDLMQWAVEMKPGQLPARIPETGVPATSGTFSTVLFDLFGFDRNPQTAALMKHYGALAWWTPDDLRASLCRPVAALTQWFDYHLFPNSPARMHVHNILWFAADLLVLTLVYRKLMGPGWAAGLAALLFLLDSNTYFPVAFVANRGFFIALFFGLLCLYEHHQWRTTKSRAAMLRSALFLALCLYAEESGASAFAFILAYALVLEPGSLRQRALTLVPSVLVIIAWRLLYIYAGYGVAHLGIYTDPVAEPLAYLRELLPRNAVLLGSQLSGVPPEFMFGLQPSLQPVIIIIYALVAIATLLVFLPWMRRDKIAAYWFAVMILAAIPEAVLVPISKNFGFIAVGAYGLIASFVGGLFTRPSRLPENLGYRIPAWIAAVLLLLAHGPGAVAGRIATTKICSLVFAWAGRATGTWPNIENQNVIVINDPMPFEQAYVPGYKAYYHQPLPRTVRTLVPGCTGFDVHRTDDQTLVIQSHGPNIFSCDNVGSFHAAYALSAFSRLSGQRQFHPGDRYQLDGLTVEILALDAAQLPSRVAFHFDAPLDSAAFHWTWFDWRTWSGQPFQVPAIGQMVTLGGP